MIETKSDLASQLVCFQVLFATFLLRTVSFRSSPPVAGVRNVHTTFRNYETCQGFEIDNVISGFLFNFYWRGESQLSIASLSQIKHINKSTSIKKLRRHCGSDCIPKKNGCSETGYWIYVSICFLLGQSESAHFPISDFSLQLSKISCGAIQHGRSAKPPSSAQSNKESLLSRPLPQFIWRSCKTVVFFWALLVGFRWLKFLHLYSLLTSWAFM